MADIHLYPIVDHQGMCGILGGQAINPGDASQHRGQQLNMLFTDGAGYIRSHVSKMLAAKDHL